MDLVCIIPRVVCAKYNEWNVYTEHLHRRKYPIRPDLNVRYIKNSLKVDSPEMVSICDAAKKHKIVVVIGYSERSGDSIYMGQSIISSSGELLLSRRKIKPTHMERTVFGEASGGDQTLRNTADTPVGRVSGLVCWVSCACEVCRTLTLTLAPPRNICNHC